MNLAIFLGCLAAVLLVIIRLRKPPHIYWLTGLLIVATLIWNQYANESCDGGCNIRVDLVIILPFVLLAVVFSVIAMSKGSQ